MTTVHRRWTLNLFLAALLLAGGCRKEEETAPAPAFQLSGELTIEAPETAVVGQSIELLVGHEDAPDGMPVFLTMSGSYGHNLLRAKFEQGLAWFKFPPEMTVRSGITQLTASADQASGQTSLFILPDQPIEPIQPLIGARSIIADGEHWAMAVVIPFDQFGNPIAEGTPVNMRSLHPQQQLKTYQPKIEHLMAWQRIYSSTSAGRTIISANIGAVHGPEGVLLEIPGWPVPFALYSDPQTLPADGFQLLTLRSDMIRDQHANIMPDGTLVNFVVDGPTGDRRVLPTVTVDGIAETTMQAPLIPGTYTIQAAVYGMASDPLVVHFTPGPAVGRFSVRVTPDPLNDALLVKAGPITGALDQYVPDGTPAYFSLVDEGGKEQRLTAVVDTGYATLSLRRILLPSGQYNISVSAGNGTGEVMLTIP